MGERHLRSRSLATIAEAAPQEPESCHDNRELASNSAEMETLSNHESDVQVDVQIDCEVGQSCDNQGNKPEVPNYNTVMLSRQIERFMESVREGFDTLKSEIHNNNSKLEENLNTKIQGEVSKLVKQIESNNIRLSETLTKQFREENEKARVEASGKLEGEMTKVQKTMEKMRSETAIEILSVSHSIESVREKLDERLTGHIEEADKRLDRITEEIKAKTRVLGIDLSRQVENTDTGIQSLKQELIQMKKRINTDVSDKIAECNNQIVADRQEYQSKLVKVNQEIDMLKKGLSVNQAGDKTSSSNDDCSLTSLANGSSQVGAESVGNTNNQASDQRNVNVCRACDDVCKCGNTVQGEVNFVSL
jgi:SMC interacting uncharacterized protein involved in chromosome segregation